jgi:GT2 family glycosyltransferase
MSNDPKIGIVILNYNNQSDTMDCLSSLFEVDYSNFLVIVVDNGSTSSPLPLIKQNFPAVLTIQNEENFGFAGGSNIGIQEALKKRCDYILLLNNDTKVDKKMLNAFIKAANEKPLGGIFGGKILRFSEPDIIDHFGGFWDKSKGDFSSIGAGSPLSSNQYNNMSKVDYVCGCLMLIKKEVIEKIGLLEPDFFLLWEESDFCFRAKKAGYEIWTVPEALIWHKVSASFTGGKIHTDYYWWRNRLLWIRRNLPINEKRKIYLKVILPDLLKLYKITFLKLAQLSLLKLLAPKKINENKIFKILRYKSGCQGILDFFLKRFGKSPDWITKPKTTKLYQSFLELQKRKKISIK